MTRKHHCRKCGLIFCNTCTGFRSTIPSFQPGAWDGKKRVCNACYKSIRVLESIEYIMRVFALIPFDMPNVCKKWNKANRALKDILRGITNKMLHSKYSRLERTLLKQRNGNTQWKIRRLCILGMHEDFQVSCSEMVQLLNCHYGVHILRTHKKWVLSQFKQFSTEDIIMFIPLWMQTNIMAELMDRANEITFAYALYFECKARSDEKSQIILSSLMKHTSKHINNEIKATSNMIKTIERNIVCKTNIIPAKLPYNTNVTVFNVLKVIQLGSNSRPHVITLETSTGEINVLVKNADLRKDRCTMVICTLLQRLCGIRCLTYPVFITQRGGWIQMLQSKTLYELGNNLSTHIYNQFQETPPKFTKAKFRKSVVGSCILSYIIGLGDRHLQNIVVCNGELAHIDFSYMFGHDPKIAQPLRVTAPTIQMMGGKESEGYNLFLKEVEEAFELVQKYSSLWCTLLENIAHAGLYTLAEIRNHSNLIGTPVIEVADIVKNHSDTWVHAIGDVMHGMFQFKL
jgi:hypothetical protein